MESKVKVLFVCLGNICRSPLAEAVFRYKVDQRELNDYFEIDSCGTSNYHIGDGPDKRTIENASNHGISIHHKARQLTKDDLKDFDIILAMDESNMKNVLILDFEDMYKDKVSLLRSFDIIERGTDVPDPYFGGPQGFENVFQIIDRSTENLLESLINDHKIK